MWRLKAGVCLPLGDGKRFSSSSPRATREAASSSGGGPWSGTGKSAVTDHVIAALNSSVHRPLPLQSDRRPYVREALTGFPPAHWFSETCGYFAGPVEHKGALCATPSSRWWRLGRRTGTRGWLRQRRERVRAGRGGVRCRARGASGRCRRSAAATRAGACLAPPPARSRSCSAAASHVPVQPVVTRSLRTRWALGRGASPRLPSGRQTTHRQIAVVSAGAPGQGERGGSEYGDGGGSGHGSSSQSQGRSPHLRRRHLMYIVRQCAGKPVW